MGDGAASIQVILFRRENDDQSLAYEEAIITAFQGGKQAGPYLVTGDDLGIQLRVFSSVPDGTVAELLHGFSHTVIVLLADEAFLAGAHAALWSWLEECAEVVLASTDQGGFIYYSFDERSRRAVANQAPKLGRVQTGLVSDLGELAIRPAMLALRVLHQCRQLLAEELGLADSRMKLFISHAKLDGLPLAQALNHQIKSLTWLQKFYDAEDTSVGSGWEKQLEKGVSSSVVIMLRTEGYDDRPWCRQEVLWADEYATPAVLVDARTELRHAPPFLPYERIPVVRIPDGNLLRILFLALREGLRFVLFRSRVNQMIRIGAIPTGELRVFCFQPSMAALLKVCYDVKNLGRTLILYPDPPYRAGTLEAATALVTAYAPDAVLATPNSLAAGAAT